MIFVAHPFYLMDYAKELLNVNVVTQYVQAIDHWAKEHNCVHLKHYMMECSEEDYIMIKLKCPEAIGG